MTEDNRAWKAFSLGIFIGFAIPMITSAISGHMPNVNSIPRTSVVEGGYIAPSRIGGIDCPDLNENGEPETIQYIDDRPYLLQEDNGRPVLRPFGVRSSIPSIPPVIVPAEER